MNETNFMLLVKGSERYYFLFDEENRTETLRQLGRYAANPELSFTWYDAAMCSQRIRSMTRNVTHERRMVDLARWPDEEDVREW